MSSPLTDAINNSIGIIQTGVALGEIIEDNFQLGKLTRNYDVNKSGKTLDCWLREHYGIKSRVKTLKMPSELALSASLMAVKNAKINVSQLDFLILNTTSGDYKQPTTATILQSALGMKKESFAIELNMPCAGNIYGLSIANAFIDSGMGSCGLVVGVDKMTTNIDSTDFYLAGMFGDAASAAVVGRNPKLAFKEFYLRSTEDADLSLVMPASGSQQPLNSINVERKEHLLQMRGAETLSFIKKAVKETIKHLLDKSSIGIQDVDKVIFHQASKPILLEVAKELGIKESQLFFTLENYGNTSSASVLLTLHEYLNHEKNSVKNIFLVGMGSGLNWGGVGLIGL